jgi:hypothetical protein
VTADGINAAGSVVAKVRQFVARRSPGSGLFVEIGETEPSLEALRWAVEIQTLIGEPIDADGQALICACLRPGSAFAMTAGQVEPTLAATYYAARALALHGRHDLLPPALPEWVEQALFGRSGVVQVDVDELFYAVRTLEQAEETLPPQRVRRVAQFIDACEDPGGGFALLPGDPPDIERTYCCLQMRRILAKAGVLEWRDPTRHRAWVAACYHEGHCYIDPARTRGSLATRYWGVQAAQLCGAPLPVDQMAKQILDAQHDDGGFGEPGPSSLWHTYCALRVLQLVDRWSGR